MVWTRAGGGHYEIVPETVSDLRQETHRSMGQSNYQWNLDSPWCRKFDLNSAKTDKVHMQETVRLPETIDLTKHSEYLKTVHPYNKEKIPLTRRKFFRKMHAWFAEKNSMTRQTWIGIRKMCTRKKVTGECLALFHPVIKTFFMLKV